MDWQGYFKAILDTLDITSGFNFTVISAVFLLAVLGEVMIQVPLLIEAFWLLVGYQVDIKNAPVSLLNMLLAFVAAQAGRQISLTSIFLGFHALNNPISKFYLKYVQGSRLFSKYAKIGSFQADKFLTLSSATVGMLTPLNLAIKVVLVLRRKLRVLLIGTLISGAAFDLTYLIIGGVFQATTLNLAYMPVFMLIGLLIFFIVKRKALK